MAANELIVDVRSGKTLAEPYFLFVSRPIPSPDQPNVNIFPPEVYSARSMISDYNESGTILDVPRRVAQSSVYGHQRANPLQRFSPGQLLQITFTPYQPQQSLLRDAFLAISGDTQGRAHYSLDRAAPGDLKNVLDQLSDWSDKQLVYLTVVIEPSVSVEAARSMALLLDAAARADKLRIEPPAAGQIWYEAFLTDPAMLDRETRLLHPWELHTRFHDGQLTGTFVQLDSPRLRATTEPKWIASEFPVASAAALGQLIQQRSDDRRPLLVYVPPGTPYGALSALLAEVPATHVPIYIAVKK